jgi:citrate/tricarballylate utilization protein
MPEPHNPLVEAQRQLTICNSCRYCEGYCAVFPALERLTNITEGKTLFLANLCHDCRACHQACMFTLPHEFAINIPVVLSQVRAEAYSRYSWPRVFRVLLRHAGVSTVGLAIGGLLLVLLVVVLAGNPAHYFDVDRNPGSFYRVVPYLVLAISGVTATAYMVTAMALGATQFWKEAGGTRREALDLGVWIAALGDVATMTNLRGGGDDCYQPDPLAASPARRLLHQAVLYGFILAFISTALAAFLQDILDQEPPFPWLSAPVITGVLGGIMMAVGCTGLLALKLGSVVKARDLISDRMLSMDVAFIAVLNLAAITGMLTLLLRDTSLMATMLTLHLASLVALYATAPYGKFVHGVYRFGALLKNRAEQRAELRQ